MIENVLKLSKSSEILWDPPPLPPQLNNTETPFQTGGQIKQSCWLPGPSHPGRTARQHCSSRPQLLLQRPHSGQVWSVVVFLPPPWPTLWNGGFTLKGSGALIALSLVWRPAGKAWGSCLPPSRCSALRAGVSLTEAHPCPQPNCRMWLRPFSLEAEAVKPVVPDVFPKELTLFASEYG